MDEWIGRTSVEFVESHRRRDDLVQHTHGFDPRPRQPEDKLDRDAGYVLYTNDDGTIYRIKVDQNSNCKCIIEYPDGRFSELRVECGACYDLMDRMWESDYPQGAVQ